MRIIHKIEENEEEYNDLNPLFMMKNKKNFFFISTQNNISAYNGFHIYENEMYKIIEDIKPNHKEPIKVINNVNSFERIYDNAFEKFSLFEEGLICESNLKSSNLEIDMRKIYDFSEFDRYFEIYSKENYVIIKYSKYNLYLCIKGMKLYEKICKWIRKDYTYDQQRGESPHRHVYNALHFRGEKVFFSASLSEEDAISKNKILETKKLEHINFQKNIAYTNALNSLNGLITDEGLYAGLPWFFQIWTRDEAISLKGLSYIDDNKLKIIKQILLRQIDKILPNGRVPNRHPESKLGSADGVGWVFKRIKDFYYIFNEEEKKYIQNKLKESIGKLEQNYISNNLIYNKAKETWMDTSTEGDTREGARIEIQALTLNMYSMFDKNKEENMKNKVREEFFKENILYDGQNDNTIRPNVFLAYYVYPELLTNDEWKNVFDKTLNKIWLSWGGLSTIDKDSKLFCPFYTNQNNKSYHRGDSWFFINNIAAICLIKLDKKKYEKYIDKIYNASKNEILSKGCIGDASEVSSASFLSSKGCFSQTWSLASFIELCNHY